MSDPPSAERLPIVDTAPPSHLAVRLDRPAEARAFGAKTAILYMHGFGSRQDGEKATFFREKALGAGLAFCSFDFQGHGQSGGGMRELSLSRNLADIGRVHGYLRAQGFRHIILFGSSMGGASALWYAALHPEDIRAAVHIAPALELESGLARLAGEAGMASWERDGVFRLEHELGAFDLGWTLIEDLRGFDPERLKDRYQTPTLLLQGRHDTSVSWRSVLDFAAGCPFGGIEVHWIGDGDHRLLPFLDHLWAITHSFLEARGVASGRS